MSTLPEGKKRPLLGKLKKKVEDKYANIKVKKETYQELKRLGVGISKAVETLAAAQKEAIQEKIGEVSEIGKELADIMMEKGLLDIKFKGLKVESASEEGEDVIFRGLVRIGIPNAEARAQLLERVNRTAAEGGE